MSSDDDIDALEAQRLFELGTRLNGMCRYDEAVVALKESMRLAPHRVGVINNLAVAYIGLRKWPDALETIALGVERDRSPASMLANAAIICDKLGVMSIGVTLGKLSLALDASRHHPMANLGSSWRDLGEIERAKGAFDLACKLAPDDCSLAGVRLISMQYDYRRTKEEVLAAHVDYGTRFGAGDHKPMPRRTTNGEPIRVAYVGPNMHTHSVSYFLAPILTSHNRDVVSVIVYSDGFISDDTTCALKSLADEWRDTSRMTADELCAAAESDRIDVLVDLAGHTDRNRMDVFCRRAAPVQVTYLGYPDTTGVPAMDYRVVDNWTDPVRSTLERPWVINGGMWAYGPVFGYHPVPYKTRGTWHKTFGSFANLAKCNDRVFRTWGHILHEVKGSGLVLKCRSYGDPWVRDRVWARLERCGVDVDRVDLATPNDSTSEHLDFYQHIDIALDTWPYNGTTTTVEAISQGVPVVTMQGDRHVSRTGTSILTQVGLESLIARNEDEYISRAVKLAGDRDLVSSLHRHLPSRLLTSSLVHNDRVSRSLETLYTQAVSTR